MYTAAFSAVVECSLNGADVTVSTQLTVPRLLVSKERRSSQFCALHARQLVAFSCPMTDPMSCRASLNGVSWMSSSDDNLVTTCATVTGLE